MKTVLLDRLLNGKKNSTAENIFICIAAALTGTFYFYEYYYEKIVHIHSLICIVISIAITAIWLICSYCSGRNKKIGFVIFAFLYWSLPYIYILYYAAKSEEAHVSKWLTFADRIAKALFYNPFYEVAKRTGASSGALAATLLILVMAAYICGYILSVRSENRLAEGSDYDGEYELDEDDEELYRDPDEDVPDQPEDDEPDEY